jgi:NAD(P)-dependent dehydrogenase (short-subunit alcohol dehydrogenase family)
MEQLAGKVALVTGAGSGIGAGMARAFAAEGMRLALADIEVEPVRALAAELEASGTEAIAVQVDVASGDAVDALAEQVFGTLGSVHIVCNNAGVCQGGPVWEMTPNDWRWLLGVNLGGVINGCRTFVPRLIAQGEPAHIVNTASVGGFLSGWTLGMYSTTKYAVVGYSEALAQELEPHRIGVSILCPGGVNTDLGSSARRRPAHLGTAPAQMDVVLDMMAAGIDPREVGRHVVRGVRENALYVFTHPEFKAPIDERFDRVRAAIERAGVPLPSRRDP